MLNRRILRIKAFKVLYSCAQNPGLSLNEALSALDASCEAVREEYVYMLGLIPALTAEAARRIEAARGKFRPTEEDLSPNLKFVQNGISALLEKDPDYLRMAGKLKCTWENNDVFLHKLYERVKTRDYYRAYMDSGTSSLKEDAALWQDIFAAELEDDEDLAAILEDFSLHWADDLPYVLNCCIRSLEDLARRGRWDCPPLYQSEVLKARGKDGVQSDRDFVHALLSAAYGRFDEYYKLVAGSVSQWDRDRLYVTDIVLIALGLAEAETFPDIPARVSINEYVEIAKYYSTPKSRTFVNGLLDKLIKERVNHKIV